MNESIELQNELSNQNVIERKIDYKNIQDLIVNFKQIHSINSKYSSDYLEYIIMPVNIEDFTIKINNNFQKFKSIFLKHIYNNKEDIEIIFLYNISYGNSRYNHKYFVLDEYIELLEKCKSYTEYLAFLNYQQYCFSSKNFDVFFGSTLFPEFINIEMIVDIKQIKYKENYIDKNEMDLFLELEDKWKLKKYEEIFYDCHVILLKFIKKYNISNGIKKNNNKKDDFNIFFNLILDDLNIPQGNKEILNEICLKFTNLRNLLGKRQPETANNEDIYNEFQSMTELNKQVITRITIDQLKTLHNIFIVLKNK